MKRYAVYAVCLAVCLALGGAVGCGKTKNEQVDTETARESVMETEQETTEVQETEAPTETQFPLPTIPEEKTFATDEETYNYAISMIKEGKHYLALKYLRKIPDYKDSKALQLKAVNAVKQDYIRYDAISEKGITHRDLGVSSEQILQRLEYGYIDNSGNLKLLTTNMPGNMYEYAYKPLFEYNKTVKFQKILVSWAVDYRQVYTPDCAIILTQEGRIIYYHFMDTTGAYNVSVEECAIKSLKEGEKIVDICWDYALSDSGNIYHMEEANSGQRYLSPITGITNAVSLTRGSGTYKELLVSDTNGVIVGVGSELKRFPVMRSWWDIVSLESSDGGDSFKYYCGLTSSGEVLIAYENGTETLRPFNPDKKYVAINCYRDKIIALAADGEVCMEVMPSLHKINSGTIKIQMEKNSVTASGTDKTWANSEEIYNYAKKCFTEGKYTEAIRYLRKIPDYKDSEKLQDEVYRYINHDFVRYGNVRYISQDIQFHYVDKDILNESRIQTFLFEEVYLAGDGTVYISDRAKRSEAYFNKYLKSLEEYNKKVKYKFISYSDMQDNQNSIRYVLTEEGKALFIEIESRDVISKLKPIDTSKFMQGEKISYISNNVAVSNKGFVYYLDGTKVTKDENLKDIVTVKAFNGILMALTTEGKIVYSQPGVYEDISGLSTWTDIVAIDMYSEGTSANYFMGLKSDGTVVVLRSGNYEVVTTLPADKKFVTISYNKSGRLISLTADGEVYVTDIVSADKKPIK